ncbi:hypothetical protein Syun_018623 [Stephania yunnanensis]|uniref:Expansin-like B1 n=1 Tax=Stephania yunnanensis TaxID=152371 RepID=A0AAP0IUY1_9MAGN
MDLAQNMLSCSALCFLVLLPALCVAQDTYTPSRATYYGSPDCLGTPSGACGYGEFGRTVNGGDVAAVSYGLYKNGTGCGACYQVRCTIPEKCTEDGVKVVVTDHGEGDHTDFILSARSYSKLAQPYMAKELIAYGVVNIEYKRIPCQYPGYNLMFKVHEHSRYPEYLAIVMIYQAGQNDITAVEFWQEDCKQWRGMRHAYGAVWDVSNPPRDTITLRIQVSGCAGTQWMVASNAIPNYWKAGVAYDSALQLA